ncbi:MAG: hypothetical protein LLG37_03635, partial [Spirochaetia bacterium]|nr:hypothetical protein [Spirochaetia bacterium]
GNFTVKSKDLRLWLGSEHLKSTNFEIKRTGEAFKFEGYGYGHGVGMSQEGARKMAQEGRSYKDILKHYYRDTRIKIIRVEK